ncbi:DUF4142 domain-containing protein [Pleomorphovibrio marinus]|uniref:DUF4142 domain-containing protein n=1 Tax=Pleomorphovibrio marinus TaxID=2164132 RepID=UPI001300765B|nr:DUF4142 domain-containing protein [Pleomorphovibrio marinus]
MKNFININSVLVFFLCLTGTLLLVTACSENKTKDSKEVAREENVRKMAANDTTARVIKDDNDSKFLMKAAEMQLEMISLGKLAQQKGNSDQVKELGKMMEEDHTKSHTEIKTLAQSKSVSIPTSVTDDSKDAYEDLNDENGNDFGKSYSKRMVNQHEDAIDLYENAAEDSEDPKVRAYASEKLPALRTHLKHAEACKEKCENEKS